MTNIYTAKNFTYKNLKTISKEAFDLHIKLYEGYVNKFNEITKAYETTNKSQANHNYSETRSLLIDKAFNHNAIILHEAFFSLLNPNPEEPNQKLLNYIKDSFENIENYIQDLKACCMSSRVGWGISILKENQIQNFAIDRHDLHIPIDGKLIIAIDTWEHAFLMDYGIDKKQYLENIFKEIDFNAIINKY